MERERDSDRGTQRQSDRQTDRETERERQRQTERQRHRETETETQRERKTGTGREGQRERERGTKRETERGTKRERSCTQHRPLRLWPRTHDVVGVARNVHRNLIANVVVARQYGTKQTMFLYQQNTAHLSLWQALPPLDK